MKDEPASMRMQAFIDALQHLESAMELLDDAGAPAQIGAHVDLAVCQLKDLIGTESEPRIAPTIRE